MRRKQISNKKKYLFSLPTRGLLIIWTKEIRSNRDEECGLVTNCSHIIEKRLGIVDSLLLLEYLHLLKVMWRPYERRFLPQSVAVNIMQQNDKGAIGKATKEAWEK